MNSTIEKLALLHEPGFNLVAFRPHQTQRGHYVWRRHRTVTVNLSYEEVVRLGLDKDTPNVSLHNQRLCEEELFRLHAAPMVEDIEEYQGEGLS